MFHRFAAELCWPPLRNMTRYDRARFTPCRHYRSHRPVCDRWELCGPTFAASALSSLDSAQRSWLLQQCDRVEESASALLNSLDHGVVHSDAHIGNLFGGPGRWRLADWGSISYGTYLQDAFPRSGGAIASAVPVSVGFASATVTGSTRRSKQPPQPSCCAQRGNYAGWLHPRRRPPRHPRGTATASLLPADLTHSHRGKGHRLAQRALSGINHKDVTQLRPLLEAISKIRGERGWPMRVG